MCFSTFLALVLGFYATLTSLACLVHQDRSKKTVSEFLGNHPLIALSGALSLMIGLLIVVSHNMWVGDGRVLITLIGWFAIVQGVARLFFPEHSAKLCKRIINGVGYQITLWVWLLLGLYLIWLAYS